MEQRLIEIEIKLSRQEDLLDTLNDSVIRQQNRIDQLESLCAALARRLHTGVGDDSEQTGTDEKPPHY